MYNSARTAGYSHNYAIQACERLEPKMPSLTDWLERAGLTNKRLAIFLSEGLEANKIIGYLHQYKQLEKGRIEKAKPDEVISNEFLEAPDWSVRLKAADLICKVKGVIDKQPLIDQSQHRHFTKIDINAEEFNRKSTAEKINVVLGRV